MTQLITTTPPPPPRPANAHKGTFGTVIITGGSNTMIGATALAASAALRSGAGLAKIATPQNILPFCLTIEPSATGIPLPINYNPNELQQLPPQLNNAVKPSTTTNHPTIALAVGPGMSIGPGQQLLIDHILREKCPTVLDADALNNLATSQSPTHLTHPQTILTPHPGEFIRLAKSVSSTLDPTDPDQRCQAAENLAAKYNSVVVLKGKNTVVTDATKTYINTTGNPALATAGTGDILTGIIAALLAQNLTPLDAASLAVYIHGLAADIWAKSHGQSGLTAQNLADLLPHTFHQYAASST